MNILDWMGLKGERTYALTDLVKDPTDKDIHVFYKSTTKSLDAFLVDREEGKHQGHEGQWVLYANGKRLGYGTKTELAKQIPLPGLFQKEYDVLIRKIKNQ